MRAPGVGGLSGQPSVSRGYSKSVMSVESGPVYCTRFVLRAYGGGVLVEDGRGISRRAEEKQAVQGGDPRSYEVEFILAPSGQCQMSVTVTFPPQWAAPGMSIGTPVITPLPGQAAPPEQPSSPMPIAERPVYGWLWRNHPKVTIPYRYN